MNKPNKPTEKDLKRAEDLKKKIQGMKRIENIISLLTNERVVINIHNENGRWRVDYCDACFECWHFSYSQEMQFDKNGDRLK